MDYFAAIRSGNRAVEKAEQDQGQLDQAGPKTDHFYLEINASTYTYYFYDCLR